MMTLPSGPLSAQLDWRVLAGDLDHPEGICWDPDAEVLYCGGEAGQVYAISLAGRVTTIATIEGGILLGLALDANGEIFVCDVGNHRVWQVSPHGEIRPYGDEIAYPNFPAFAPDGTLFVSDSGSVLEASGSIVAISASGEMRPVHTGPIGYANGLAIGGEYLYYVASTDPAIWRVALTGSVPELVIALERCTPDGLCFDADGGLYISCFQPNQLWRYREGELEMLFDDWSGEFALSPTNVCFYGPELDRLALASLCGHQISTIDVGVRGRHVARPTRGAL